jgi:proteasome lid subunit RPN8/RPN11
MPRTLVRRLLHTTRSVQLEGLKSFGLLLADPRDPGYPFAATDVFFFDPHKNRRNDQHHRGAFEAQGAYFRDYDDAGFVADAAELLAADRLVERSGLEIVAPFHTHRRQPANFSTIDFRLHNPAFPWHLIISFADSLTPVMRPFHVRKDGLDFGISEQDAREHSELAYIGPEVAPLQLVKSQM